MVSLSATPAAQEPRFSGPSSQALHQLFNDYWEWRLATEPELATRVGRSEHNAAGPTGRARRATAPERSGRNTSSARCSSRPGT